MCASVSTPDHGAGSVVTIAMHRFDVGAADGTLDHGVRIEVRLLLSVAFSEKLHHFFLGYSAT
jgi:hypothetical protein